MSAVAPVQRTTNRRTYRLLWIALSAGAISDNDQIVTRYMSDGDFQDTAYPILAREIFEAVRKEGFPSFDRT